MTTNKTKTKKTKPQPKSFGPMPHVKRDQAVLPVGGLAGKTMYSKGIRKKEITKKYQCQSSATYEARLADIGGGRPESHVVGAILDHFFHLAGSNAKAKQLLVAGGWL